MKTLIPKLINDEAGFIVSAELVLISTIAVLGLIVGLSEVAHSVNNELEDVASAFGSMNQSFENYGSQGHAGSTTGSYFDDETEFCDNACDIVLTDPMAEGGY